jgi:hypothetical protein
MINFVPSGYVLLRELVKKHGETELRNMLFKGEYEAFKFDERDGRMHDIFAQDWSRKEAGEWLKAGKWWYTSVDTLARQGEVTILVKLPDESKPQSNNSLELPYLSPLMEMMLEAIRKFKITDAPNPGLKKVGLENHFLSLKLPDGTPISKNQAKSMASFVRPPRP